METLKSGDVPALVTNIEVMRILSDRAESRSQEAAAGTKRPRKGRGRDGDDGRHRHRDWIEGKVLKYLRSECSPCKDVDPARMPELVGELRAPARGSGGSADAAPDKGAPFKSEDDGAENDDAFGVERRSGDGRDEEGFGLTDGETLQVLNHMPREAVELHLIVEDLPIRMSEERQGELLELVGRYVGGGEEEEGQARGEGAGGEGRGGEQKEGGRADDDCGGDEEILGTIDDDNGDGGDEKKLGTIDDDEFGLRDVDSDKEEEHVVGNNGTRANWGNGPVKSEPP